MRHDRTDILLQLAFLEGVITTRGLYESIAARKSPALRASHSARSALQRRLEAALENVAASREAPLTVGAFLKKGRLEQALRPQEISSRVGLSSNIYTMLEHDRISPLKIPPEIWKKLRGFFRCTTDELIGMIRRTHQLVWFRPSFRTALARYDIRKNKTLKKSTLEQAAAELYVRGKLSIPSEEQRKLDVLFQALRDES